MQFRKAVAADLDTLCDILTHAKAAIKSLGIDQWQKGIPNPDMLAADIERGEGHVLEQDGQIAAYGCFIFDPDPTYKNIYEGQWHSVGDYLAIHRVMVSPAFLRHSCGGQLMDCAAELAKSKGVSILRIDTHRGNLPMQGMIGKSGFTYCGIIYLEDGDERLAFDKQI